MDFGIGSWITSACVPFSYMLFWNYVGYSSPHPWFSNGMSKYNIECNQNINVYLNFYFRIICSVY